MLLLSIDPSITAIGVAILNGIAYQDSYTLRTKPTDSTEDRLRIIQDHFKQLKIEYSRFDCIVIEYPDSFVRQGAVGVKNFKALQLLHVAIGTIFGTLVGEYGGIVHFVKPSQWKGWKHKTQTQQLAKYYTPKKLNSHEADATIMGIWKAKDMKWKQQIRQT